MSKTLYVSSFFPRKNSGHAGGRVAFENLMRLKSQGAVDVVICTSEPVESDSTSDLYAFHQSKMSLVKYLFSNFGNLSWQEIVVSPIIHTRLNVSAENLICELLNQQGYAEVFVDFTQTLLLTRRALVRSQKSPRITACLHDVFAQRMIRSKRSVDNVLTGFVCRQEQILVSSVHKVLTLSVKDKNLLTGLYSASDVDVKKFSAPDWSANVVRNPDSIDPYQVVFFANFDRAENSSGALWFVDAAMPHIQAVMPEFKLLLVGTGSDRLSNRIRKLNVTGVGFVLDPSQYFTSCACVIAPLFEGAGVKFKVLEALSCGVPVVGTPVACEGIDVNPLLFCADSSIFAEETIRVLKLGFN